MNQLSPKSPITTQAPSQVVLIHGAGHDHRVWSALSAELASNGCKTLALDLPGHGQSSALPCDDIESMAGWLVDHLSASAAGPVAIAGHSMGSLVALEACALQPSLFSHLILLGSVFPMPVAQGLLDAAQQAPETAFALINKWSFSAESPDTLRADNLALMRSQAPGVLFRDLAACNAYSGGLDAAAKLNCPVCLISGNSDRMTPVKSLESLKQALENTRNDVTLMTLDQVGHALMTEAPAPVARCIASWLKEQAA